MLRYYQERGGIHVRSTPETVGSSIKINPLRPCCLLPRAATPPRCGSKGSMAAAHCKSLNQKALP